MSKSHLYGCIDVDGRKRNKVVSETNKRNQNICCGAGVKEGTIM